MLEKQQKGVERRQHLIYQACEQLVQEGKLVDAELVFLLTGIPKRTIEQREYYNSILNRYKPQPKTDEGSNQNLNFEAEHWKQEAEYWRALAQSLSKQNKGLRTFLVERGNPVDREKFPKLL